MTLAIAGAMLLAVALASAVGADAASVPQPTHIAIAVSSTYPTPCAPPDCTAPAVLVKQGDNFVLTVTLTDDAGTAAAFTKDTKVNLTATGPGKLSTSTITLLGGVSQPQSFNVSYSLAAYGIVVTASLGGKPKLDAIAPASSNAFDVLLTLKQPQPASAHSPFAGGTGVDDCAMATAANPVCGYLVLPNGANSAVVLATAPCDDVVTCPRAPDISEIFANLTGLYDATSPATLIIKCYRSICGKGGVNSYVVQASQSASGPLSASPPCPFKNTIGAGQQFCTDYAASSRVGVDNLWLHVLFADDFRGSI